MKRFFEKHGTALVCLIGATIIVALLCGMFVCEVVSRGGWHEYVASNPFASAAVAYVFAFLLVYAVGVWVAVITWND